MELLADKQKRVIELIKALRQATKGMTEPASVSIVKEYGRDPFLVLVACILSLRTRDPVSLAASHRLFKHAKTPQKLLKVPISTVEKEIHSTGFYRQKAKQIHGICKALIERFDGKVPQTEKELSSIKGIGHKTAALVLAEGFRIPAMIVDTHVHRIANQLGLVHTKTPAQTHRELEKVVPKEYWIEFSRLVVRWGQNIRQPLSFKTTSAEIIKIAKEAKAKKNK